MQGTKNITTQRPRKSRKVYARAIIALVLLVTWALATVAGLLLWIAPSGPQSGRQLLLFGLTKHNWANIHLVFSLVAVGVTVLHIIVDWKALKGCVRYLTSTQRSPKLIEKTRAKS